MFSVIFPGQGSQYIGMGLEIYKNHQYVKELFNLADDVLGYKLSKIIFDGPKQDLDLTENTQPAIFLISMSIFEMIKNETDINLNNAKYFAGHSLGEYSALTASKSISFDQTIKLLNKRGKSMQTAVPKGEGGMKAILGAEIIQIEQLLEENKKSYKCYIANDNSVGQVVVSGRIQDLNLLSEDLRKKSIKYIDLPVSAPFHCPLMNKATEIMKDEINKTIFKKPINEIISNVTSEPVNEPEDIKKLLIKQIESSVRWRETVLYIGNRGVKNFIEIGPGKVLSGLIKRIDRNLLSLPINSIDDIKKINLDDKL